MIKNLLKKLVLFELRALARRRMKRFKGKVIAVTGSVGKTTTKDAIFSVLNSQFKVKTAKKSMNSDFGLSLTILDIDSGFSSITKWSWYLLRGFLHSFMKDYSEILLVEMGVDKPKDMDFLLSIVRPHVAVFTNVSNVHIGDYQFKDINEVFAEKSKMIEGLREKGQSVLNIDDDMIRALAKKRRNKSTITFGKSKDADFCASQIKTSIEGSSFVLHYDNKRYQVECSVISECQIYSVVSAIVCGVLMGIPIENAIGAVKLFSPPPGRMSVIKGIEDSTVIDGSYNSSPSSLKAALLTLSSLGENRRKIAVLGSMNELGERSKELHLGMGEDIANCADILIAVGGDAKFFAESAIKKGFNKNSVHVFSTALSASEFFKDKIKKGDLVLVKGSQNNVRLERFVKEIMLSPEDAKHLLVRQEKEWLNKL